MQISYQVGLAFFLAAVFSTSGQQAQVDFLEQDLATKLAAANTAESRIETLRTELLRPKKLIPRDPWRQIYNQTRYVNSEGSGFVKFSGQIQEVAQTGIRVLGQYGDSKSVEFFVLNFPHKFGVGENVPLYDESNPQQSILARGDAPQLYVAFADGEFSYVTEDGYAKKIPKLNYGVSCARPKNAQLIELAAQQLTPAEEAIISNAKATAKALRALATETQRLLINAQVKAKEEAENAEEQRIKYEAASAKAEAERIAENERLTAIKISSDKAASEKGDWEATRRLALRFRVGDGVKQDAQQAREFEAKAEAQEKHNLEQKKAAEKLRVFNWHLDQSQKGKIPSLVYLGKCYRDGDGVEKDLEKAKEYFKQASGFGLSIIETRKLLETCN